MNWFIFSIIVIAFLVIVFTFAYIIFHRVSVRKKPRKNDIHSLFSQNKLDLVGEETIKNTLEWIENSISDHICIDSEDGLKLHAFLINVENAKGVVIIFHGYRSFGTRDFCLQLPIIHEAGYNIMLVDQRAHGKSEGKYICYGTKECNDAVLWRKKASEIYGDEMPIALFGLSMGGATVLMASGEIPNDDKQVKCVIADCPFYDAQGIITHVLWKYFKIYPKPIIHFVKFWCRFVADFNLNSPTCSEQAKKSSLPFLIFHGKNDEFVPTECSIKLAKEIGESAKLVLVDEARHAEAIYYNGELYKAELLTFLSKYML